MTWKLQTIALGFVNSYLVNTGDGFILIDTGIRSSLKTIEAALASARCKPGDLKLIILTHGDIDHTANGAYLRDKYHTSLAMHRGDADMVASGDMGPQRTVKSPFMRMLHRVMRLTGSSTRMAAGFTRFSPDLYLEDGQNLKEYGFDAVVLHIPGHTAGSIALLTTGGDLICGDTLENRARPRSASIVADETNLAASLARLEQMDIQMVYPGHGKPFAWKTLSFHTK